MDKIIKSVIFLLTVGLVFSCGEKNLSQKNKKIFTYKPVKFTKSTYTKNKKNFLQKQNPIVKPPPLLVGDTLEEIDPLEDKYISLSARNAKLRDVLYIISKDLGLNLVVSPEVDLDKTLTANFNRTSAKEALNVIEEITGVYFKVKDNILYVKELQTKIFKIPYIKTISEYNANLGGDVLGSVGTGAFGGGGGVIGGGGGTAFVGGFGGGGNLTGNFQLNFINQSGFNDFYGQIEENIKSLLSKKGSYTLNRFTGTLTITDKKENIKKIEKFLSRIKKEASKQVLIEAKIVEVNLSDEFQFGVDWNLVFRDVAGGTITASQSLALGGSYSQILVTGSDFSSILNALSKYSKLQTLSNPRIRVLNGQSALISTGVVTPFWEKQVQITTGTATTQSVSYVRSSVLDGILLGVSPYIEDDGSITLNIVPVSTNIRGTKQLIVNSEVQAEAPVLEIKEAGTTIRVKDGDLVIIGGLITRGYTNVEKSVPFVSKVPVIGNLFKSIEKNEVKKELIIFIRPKIIREDWE